MRMPKIKDVIPFPDGVFTRMNYDFHDIVDASTLDFLFMSSFSKRNVSPVIEFIKELSPEYEDDPFAPLEEPELLTLAARMLDYYKNKWDRLAEVYSVEYDPIHNYLDEWEDTMDQDSSESETSSGTDTMLYNSSTNHNNTRTDDLVEETERDLTNGNTREFQNDKTRTDYNSGESHTIDANDPMREDIGYGRTDTKRGEENTVNSGSDTNSVWGFNSSDAVNSDRTTLGTTNRHTFGEPNQGNNPLVETLGGHDVTVKTGTNTDSKTGYDESTRSGRIVDNGTEGGEETVTNTGTVTNVGTDSHSGTDMRTTSNGTNETASIYRDRSGKHFGNIGNLTSQKMLNEEIELWKWNYIQAVLDDARDFLTLPVYL